MPSPVSTQSPKDAVMPRDRPHREDSSTGGEQDTMAAGTSGSTPSAQDETNPTMIESKQRAKALLNATRSSKERQTSRPNSASSGRSSNRPQPSSAARSRPSTDKLHLDQYITRDLLHAAALGDQVTSLNDLSRNKRREAEYYQALRRERQVNPGAVFGYGYAGFGNARTNDKPRIIYPSQRRRPGGRMTRELRVSRKDMALQAEQLEELIPVRLEIDMDKLKLRDTFTWNLHDRVVSPELFAEQLVEDFQLAPETAVHLRQYVTQSLLEQIQDFYPHVYIAEDALDPLLPYHAYKNDEMRILIKLNITIGQHTLVDQFEWEINNPANSPEEFANQITRDMSLSGEFATAIAHSIREQSQLFTRSLYITGHPFDGRPVEDADLKNAFLPSPLPSVFRQTQHAKDYTPYFYILNDTELDKTEKSLSREQRRQKRSVNRRGGPALPDLKDRQSTIRTLVISSVIPGAAETLEESRMFKRPEGSGRGRRAQKDYTEDSDSSESEDSGPESPGAPIIYASGTSRTRGTRGAASAAQAAMKANYGRSATPDTISLHHHETRTSGRKSGGGYVREESVPDSLIVRLKIRPASLRALGRGRSARRSTPQQAQEREGSAHQRPQSAIPVPAPQAVAPPSQHTSSTTAAQPPAMQQTGSSTINGANLSVAQQSQLSPQAQGQLFGAIRATRPPQPGQALMPPPDWLVTALGNLKANYPHDSFEGTMRYAAVDTNTGQAVPNQTVQQYTSAGQPLPAHIQHFWLPRIRCNDCPGKLYTSGPGTTVENFEIHLRNRQHRERVDSRVAGG